MGTAGSRSDSAVLPRDFRWQELRVGGRTLLIASHPITGDAGALGGLTGAQRHVILLAAEGLTNDEIARVRGTTTRTVAKLLELAYRRLGVHSRAEAVARMTASGGR
jgi:DNA-binding CsgD family transcriptional regulator